MSNTSLPYDYDNIGEALDDADGENAAHRFRFHDEDASTAPRGTFYDPAGNARSWPFAPFRARAPSNQYGWLLNAYGEPGDRRVWLTYTAGARQSH